MDRAEQHVERVAGEQVGHLVHPPGVVVDLQAEDHRQARRLGRQHHLHVAVEVGSLLRVPVPLHGLAEPRLGGVPPPTPEDVVGLAEAGQVLGDGDLDDAGAGRLPAVGLHLLQGGPERPVPVLPQVEVVVQHHPIVGTPSFPARYGRGVEPAGADDALFVPEGDRFVPTVLTRGPWDPGAQHGGPPAALLTRAVETVGAPVPMAVARLTVELLRPVPLRPLSFTTTVLRPGRKVQLVGASLFDEDAEVARVTALRVRVTRVPLPPGVGGDEEPAPPGPETGEHQVWEGVDDFPGFVATANDVRYVAGGIDRPGPATAWVRLRFPVVAGEVPSPAMRAAAAADFGNGFSWVLPRPGWRFINADLSVHLARLPEGEWVCLQSRSYPTSSGIGLAESVLRDTTGRFGRSVQSLLVEPDS